MIILLLKKSLVTLVERLSKVIITLKPCGRLAVDIENRLNTWFESVPKHLFKPITFDCGKEFSNCKQISKMMMILSNLIWHLRDYKKGSET